MQEVSLDEIDRVIQYFRRWPFPLTVYTVEAGQLVPGKLAKFLHFFGFHFFDTYHSFDLPYPSYLRICICPSCRKRQEKTDDGWEDY